jgi:hypothetical protein
MVVIHIFLMLCDLQRVVRDLCPILYIIPIRNPERLLSCQVVEAPIVSRQLAYEDGNVVSPRYPPPSPLRRYPWYSSPLQTESTVRT